MSYPTFWAEGPFAPWTHFPPCGVDLNLFRAAWTTVPCVVTSHISHVRIGVNVTKLD